jgi:tRNA dimethylallyltransferase
MKQLALIGPTASGKTALSLQLAKKLDAVILSLDSLAIYKEIDIASAKPTLAEREGIFHYGIDEIAVTEEFDVTTYIDLYLKVSLEAKAAEKNLIIVGGTSFYLKMLIEGISDLPTISKRSKAATATALKDLSQSYAMLSSLDPAYMQQIASHDSYRIEKVLDLYHETGAIPSEYFKNHPPKPAISEDLPLYQITIDRTLLRERITQRTEKMLGEGLIDEVCMLERRYSREPYCMKAIGIKETLGFLDGLYTKNELLEKISTNTARLAKRQNTFNRSQFAETFEGSAKEIYQQILSS